MLFLLKHGYFAVWRSKFVISHRKLEFPSKINNPSVSMETDVMLHFLSQTDTGFGFLTSKLPNSVIFTP